MKQDKKKIVVLIALAVVILAVGAFSFLPTGGAPAAEPSAKSKETKSDSDGKVAQDATKSDTGASSFEGSVEGAVPAAGGETAEKEPPKNPTVATSLPQRDPFTPADLAPTETAAAATPPVPAANPAPNPAPQRDRVVRRRTGGGGGLGGNLPPFAIDKTGQLPGANGSVSLSPNPDAALDPSAFSYKVSGLIVGNKPAAVFTDSQGNQRLVTVGGSLDGDSQVTSIDRNRVTVRHRGKTMRLTVGGNPQQ
jgi:hypothetical protein